MPVPSHTRRVALRCLRSGLFSISDVAEIAGVDPSTVWRWCKAEGIDVDRERLQRLVTEWVRAEAVEDGRFMRRPSKDEQRARAERLIACMKEPKR